MPGIEPDLRKLRKEAHERFLAGRRAETQYARQLSQVAKHVGNIIDGMAPEGVATNPVALADHVEPL
jgi:hypothetical protein